MKKIFFLLIFLSPLNIVFAQPDSDSVQNWVDARVENAKAGKKEKVKMVMAVRTLAWGCKCPDHYMGVSSNNQEGPFISPTYPNSLPLSDTIGYSLIVEGYFTGNIIDQDMRDSEDEPEEWFYHLQEFTITKWTKNKKGYDAVWMEIK
jgi:hypothetical protein